MGAEPLTFGLSLPNRAVLFGVPFASLLEAAVRAEESGQFDSIWVGDNFLSKPRLEALVTLAAIAARTTRVRLGTICLATFPMRHPLPLAIQWASLDVISGGRTILVVCNGGAASDGPLFRKELDAMGVKSRERVARLEEGIQLLRAFWGPDPVTWESAFYRFDAVNVLPKPVQERLPIAIAANPSPILHRAVDPAIEERVLRRVARLADGWQTDGTPPEVLRSRWQRIQEYAAEYGRADEVRHISLHLMVHINDDRAAAERESVEFLNRYYGVGSVPPEFLEHWLAAGPPALVAEKILRFVAAGCTTPVLRFTAFDQMAQLERCIAEVMPVVRQG